MTAQAPVTFRDFAAAAMAGDVDRAAMVLQTLLSLPADAAVGAATHFASQMASAGQPFMMKAMGLRQAVAGGNDAELEALLGECFGLSGELATTARETLRASAG